jgi:hypothetical protein
MGLPRKYRATRGPGAGASVGGFTLSTTDLKIPGAWIYPSSGTRCRLPAPDGHYLSPLRDLIAA